MAEFRKRHAAVIVLLDEWLADESGYDENTWPGLKEQIEESRTSTRRLYASKTGGVNDSISI